MARRFGGTDSFATNLSFDPVNLTTVWTVACWVWAEAYGLNAAVFTPQYTGANMPVVLAPGPIGGQGTDCMYAANWRSDAGGWRAAFDTDVIPKKRWTHFVGMWTGSNMKLYRDGFVRGVDSRMDHSSGPVAAPAGVDLYVGRIWGGGTYFQGMLEDLAVWNAVVPDAMIQKLASDRSFRPSQVLPGYLKGYWPLDGASVDRNLTAQPLDLTGSGNTGPAPEAVPRWANVGGAELVAELRQAAGMFQIGVED